MSTTFEDRGKTLFGRAPDLAFLHGRVHRPGVTILRSRAQMGKTTLLLQLAYKLSAKYDIGYTETSGQTTEPLRYAVQDLYARWLTGSTYGQQAHAVFLQHKDRFVENFGTVAGSLFTTFAKAFGKPAEIAAAAAKTLLDGLVQANQNLRTGGQQLPQLQIDQARDLLQTVADITDRHLVIILDQWEKSTDLAAQLNLLELFLKHLDEWPSCHIVVGTRDDQPLSQLLDQRIGLGFHEKDATLHDLPIMHLEDGEEAARLLAHIRARHTLARTLPDADLLSLIAGYPEVVNRWMRADAIPTRDDLKRLADNAHRYLYPEFQQLLPQLSPAELRLILRLALLPGAGDSAVWPSLKPILMDGVQPSDCGKLHRLHLLDRPSPPSFGHAKRAEIALAILLKDFSPELTEACEHLVLRLAQQIHDVAPHSLPFASGLVSLASFVAPLDLSPAAHLLCYAACCLSKDVRPQLEPALVTAAKNILGINLASVTTLVAMAITNTLMSNEKKNNQQHREELLQVFGDLAQKRQASAVIKRSLSSCLFNALIDAKQQDDTQRRGELLQDLRNLLSDYPTDPIIRQNVAMGLVNTLQYAQEEGSHQVRDDLLDELRELYRKSPTDPAIRLSLATGIYNTRNAAKQENDLQRRDHLLQELKDLKREHPQDAVWELLAQYINLDEELP